MYSNFLILISEHNHYHNPLHKNMIIIIAFRVEKKEYGCSPVVIWSVNTRAQLSLPFLKLVNDQSRCFSFTKLFACTFFLFDIFLKSSSLCCVLKSNKRKINIEEISLEIPLCFYNVKDDMWSSVGNNRTEEKVFPMTCTRSTRKMLDFKQNVGWEYHKNAAIINDPIKWWILPTANHL